MSSLKMICSDTECRSENVTVDASARWDKHKEQWVIEKGSEYPKNGYCYDCGEHTSVQEMRHKKVQNKAIPLNIDEWKYFHDATGQVIVVNAWIDDSYMLHTVLGCVPHSYSLCASQAVLNFVHCISSVYKNASGFFKWSLNQLLFLGIIRHGKKLINIEDKNEK